MIDNDDDLELPASIAYTESSNFTHLFVAVVKIHEYCYEFQNGKSRTLNL